MSVNIPDDNTMDIDTIYTDKLGNPISKYEYKRLKRIEMNEEIMAKLGIKSDVELLNKNQLSEPKKERAKRQRVADIVGRRESLSRVSKTLNPKYTDLISSDVDDEDDDEDDSSFYPVLSKLSPESLEYLEQNKDKKFRFHSTAHIPVTSARSPLKRKRHSLLGPLEFNDRLLPRSTAPPVGYSPVLVVDPRQEFFPHSQPYPNYGRMSTAQYILQPHGSPFSGAQQSAAQVLLHGSPSSGGQQSAAQILLPGSPSSVRQSSDNSWKESLRQRLLERMNERK